MIEPLHHPPSPVEAFLAVLPTLVRASHHRQRLARMDLATLLQGLLAEARAAGPPPETEAAMMAQGWAHFGAFVILLEVFEGMLPGCATAFTARCGPALDVYLQFEAVLAGPPPAKAPGRRCHQPSKRRQARRGGPAHRHPPRTPVEALRAVLPTLVRDYQHRQRFAQEDRAAMIHDILARVRAMEPLAEAEMDATTAEMEAALAAMTPARRQQEAQQEAQWRVFATLTAAFEALLPGWAAQFAQRCGPALGTYLQLEAALARPPAPRPRSNGAY